MSRYVLVLLVFPGSFVLLAPLRQICLWPLKTLVVRKRTDHSLSRLLIVAPVEEIIVIFMDF